MSFVSCSLPKSFRRVRIIDDDINMRKSVANYVHDAGLTPIDVPGPLSSLRSFVVWAQKNADGAICDHRLSSLGGGYANFLGADVVCRFYQSRFPALLCTNFSTMDVDIVRPYRRYIPVLLRPDDLDPDLIRQGLAYCRDELKGRFRPERRPWRTLVRVEALEEQDKPKMAIIVLPGWSSNERIRLPLDMLPPKLTRGIKAGTRFHAQVNLGDEDPESLYFDSPELD